MIGKPISREEVLKLSTKIMEDAEKRRSVQPCKKCGGAGWLWWDELDEYDGPAHETGQDDTKYSCDTCDGADDEHIEAQFAKNINALRALIARSKGDLTNMRKRRTAWRNGRAKNGNN